MKVLISLLVLVISAQAAIQLRRENVETLSAEHVDYINQLNTTWTAAQNFKGLKIDDLKKLAGSLEVLGLENEFVSTGFEDVRGLPENFDSREAWPECADVISHIRDQGSCGSCWAVAAASAITDRVCIASDGKNKTILSEQTLISCCDSCYETEGCQGGYPVMAFSYWARNGLVSGGDYGSKTGCAPYLIAPCEHHVDGPRTKCGSIIKTPKCEKKCSNEEIDFESDKNFGKSIFRSGNNVGEIKAELMRRGPMSASFVVYDDFFLYKEGVYQVTHGASYVGGHAVTVIGFGKENGVDYFLAKNSWNTDWGSNGYFKIKVGEAGINRGFVSGIARK